MIVPDGIPANRAARPLRPGAGEAGEEQERPRRVTRPRTITLLTTKLFCGYCGAYLCGESGTSRTGKVHHYYKCVSVKKERAPSATRSPSGKNWIEDLVAGETMKMVMDDKAIEAIVSMLMDLQEQGQCERAAV